MSARTDFPRVLLVSDKPIYRHGGTTGMLTNLFGSYPPECLQVVSTLPLSAKIPLHDLAPALVSRTTLLSIWPVFKRTRLNGVTYLGSRLLVPYLTNRIVDLADRTGTQVIWTCFTGYGLLLAAPRAGRRLGIPHVFLLSDDPPETIGRYLPWAKRELAQRLRQALEATALVYTISPQLQAKYLKTYGVSARWVGNAVDTLEFQRMRQEYAGVDRAGPVRILYAGSIGLAHFDALDSLIRAITSLNQQGFACRLVLHSRTTSDDLESWGWPKEYIELAGWVGQEELGPHLARADILFLPHTFDKSWSGHTATSFPSKLPVYLAIGRPILVHAPAYSTAAVLTAEWQAAEIVDTPDHSRLIGSIRRLAQDKSYAEELSRRAMALAREHFHLPDMQALIVADLRQLCCARSPFSGS